MRASRSYPRSLLVILLVAGCAAAAIAPVLVPVQAAPVRAAPVGAPLDHIVISEFRTDIPNGLSPLTNSFIELFNPTGGPLTIGAGWKLERSNCAGTTGTIYLFSADVILAAGQHYLIGGQTYSGSVTPDLPKQNIDVTNNGGIGLVDETTTPSTLIDGVGMCDTAMFVERPQLTPLTGTFDQSYDRVQDSAGMCQDTDHNASDFFLRSPSNPQNMSSPIVPASCGDPTQTISGNVTGVAGAVLTYGYLGGPDQKVTAGAGGAYAITVPHGASGTVTPSKPGYVFTPPSKAFPNIVADQTQNFTAARSPATATPIPGYLSVLINEVAFGGTTATANDQWIELYNPNSWDINVVNWELTGAAGTGGTVTLTGVIRANCFLVIERNATVFQTQLPLVNGCRARTLVDTNMRLSTYGALLSLSSNTGALIDTANHDGGPWPAGVANPDSGVARRSMERHGRADTDTDWYTFIGPPPSPEVLVFDRDNHVVKGTPGEKNWATFVTATPSPVPTKYKTPTAPPPTPFGHMVLNEFLPRAGHDYNQDGAVDVFDEFIEVKNLGPISANLSGWKIDVISSAGSSSYNLPSKVLQPNERAVYYGSVTHISLHDSGGTVRLTNTRGVIIDARGYDPVSNPDQSTCRLPDGYYWRFPCFPTPGNENSQTGIAPIPPPNTGGHPAPCLLADTVPDAFRLAECNGFGSDIFNAKYWDDQSGFKDFPVLDMLDKWLAIVK